LPGLTHRNERFWSWLTCHQNDKNCGPEAVLGQRNHSDCKRGGEMMALDFKRILCPVDLSRLSLDALKLSTKLAQSSGATLYLLHVIDNPFDELYMTSITQADPALLEAYRQEPLRRAKVMNATVEHSKVMLKQFCHESVEHLSKVRYLIGTGNPFEKILDAAESHRIDLIVLATHGRTGVKRLLIGNVAEKVVRHAPCPVLTVKPRVVTRRGKSGRAR
jgi:nucleotide-binding universal stress UspA family protein